MAVAGYTSDTKAVKLSRHTIKVVRGPKTGLVRKPDKARESWMKTLGRGMILIALLSEG